MSENVQTAAPEAAKRQKLPENLHRLVYWLANEDIYTSDYVRKWLQRVSREEAAQVLSLIARIAEPEPHSILYMLFIGLLLMFTASEVILEKSPAGRKAGIRAAQLLLNMNDARCLTPLVRVFETSWLWQSKYQEAIETALIRFLSGEADQEGIRRNIGELRTLAKRVWNTGGGKKELSPRYTDLLLATLRWIQESQEAEDVALLESIALARVKTPNRKRVQEAVHGEGEER